MRLRVSFVPTEKVMACAMAAEEGQKWPQRHYHHPSTPNSTGRCAQWAISVKNYGGGVLSCFWNRLQSRFQAQQFM